MLNMNMEPKALKIFFIINIIISSIFFILSFIGLFVSRGPEPTSFLNLAIWSCMGFPFYFSLIPLLTFIFRKKINSILVGIITLLWIFFFMFVLLVLIASTSTSVIPFLKSSGDSTHMIVRIISSIMGLFLFYFPD